MFCLCSRPHQTDTSLSPDAQPLLTHFQLHGYPHSPKPLATSCFHLPPLSGHALAGLWPCPFSQLPFPCSNSPSLLGAVKASCISSTRNSGRWEQRLCVCALFSVSPWGTGTKQTINNFFSMCEWNSHPALIMEELAWWRVLSFLFNMKNHTQTFPDLLYSQAL